MRHWSRARSGLLISMLKKLNCFCFSFLTGLITLMLLTWEWIGLFLRKNHLLRCQGWFFLLNWIEAVTLSLLLELPPRKLKLWFVLWSFFLLKLFCVSRNLSDALAWNTCHVWASATSCYLELVDKLQKLICRTVHSSLTTSLEPLADCQNVASTSLFHRYYFSSCSSELA